MSINPIVLSIPIYFLLIGIELLVQWFTSRKIYRLSDALTNISCGIIQQLTGLFLKVLSVTIYFLVFQNLRLYTIPVNWITITILFFLVDLCYYWAHRMSHEVNLFWGGHVVHHQSEDYNFSVALRQGSFQVIWTFSFYLPLAVMGFDPATFVLISALNTVYQFWIHTETIGKLGPLEWIFNTPSHHRVHHGRDPKYIDKNHAGVFIIWDRMFGTFQVEEETPTYGITTPTNSWNPVWVNLKHYVQMVGWLKSARTFSDKMGILFNKPGWFPDYMGGYQTPTKVNKQDYKKYDHGTTRKRGVYVFVQYLLALGGTAFFLFNQANFDGISKIVMVTLLILAITVCGGILDDRKWAFSIEYYRIVLTVVIVIYFFIYPLPLSYPYIFPIIAGLITLIWFEKIKK